MKKVNVKKQRAILFLLVNRDDLSHLWKVAWKLRVILKEAWNADDTTFTSELQNVTIILPFMSKIFDNINVQKVFRDAQEYVDIKQWGKLSKEEVCNFKCACHTPAMKPY